MNVQRNMVAEATRLERSVAQPSSIGLAWPPRYDSWNSRVKGWGGLIETRQGIETKLAKGVEEATNSDATRLTLRFIASNKGIRLLRDHLRSSESLGTLFERDWSGGIEAIIDVSRVSSGHSIVYYGFNAPGRATDSTIADVERTSATAANAMPVIPLQEALKRVQNAGIVLEVLQHASQEEIALITRLYQQAFPRYVFPLNEETVENLINDTNNLSLVARSPQGKIISILVAEHAEFFIGTRRIDLIEVSEAATDNVYRGFGLLTALYQQMIGTLHQGYDSSNTVVYAEARAPWIPAGIVTRRGGLELCGMLSQPCTINGNRSPGMQYEGVFEDLTVWAHQSF